MSAGERFTSYLRRVSESRRGMALVLVGAAWIVQGLTRILISTPTGNPLDVPHESVPDDLIGVVWVLCGVVALVGAIRSTGADVYGFVAASTMPGLLAASYLVSWLTWALSLGEHGWRLGLLGFTAWGCIIGLIGLIASWPEVPPAEVGGEGEEGDGE